MICTVVVRIWYNRLSHNVAHFVPWMLCLKKHLLAMLFPRRILDTENKKLTCVFFKCFKFSYITVCFYAIMQQSNIIFSCVSTFVQKFNTLLGAQQMVKHIKSCLSPVMSIIIHASQIIELVKGSSKTMEIFKFCHKWNYHMT